jgi:AraC-like DNA-binding protein
MSGPVALSDCRIDHPPHFGGAVEIVSAEAAPRPFPSRVSHSLGICLKRGSAHAVRSEGRALVYPADSICVRPPGCIWSSEAAAVGFWSLDIAPELLGPAPRDTRMRFCGADRVPHFERLCAELVRGGPRLRSSELVTAIVNAVIDAGALASDGFEHQENELAVRRARDLLAAHPEDNLRLDDVAAAAGLNKFALLRQFRRALGTTPHAYVILCRVERARFLLSRGATAAEAAARAGFADQAHMTRQFKRQFGLTPSAYARAARTTVGPARGPQARR